MLNRVGCRSLRMSEDGEIENVNVAFLQISIQQLMWQMHVCAYVLACRAHTHTYKHTYDFKLLVEYTNKNARARLFATGCLPTPNNKSRTPCRATRTHTSTCTQALAQAAVVRQPPSLHSLPTTTNQKICLRIVAKREWQAKQRWEKSKSAEKIQRRHCRISVGQQQQ